MSQTPDRRRFDRFRVPVVIDAPELCALPLVPEDVGAGGFRVIVPDRPEVGMLVPCSIQTDRELYDNCLGQVVWMRAGGENGDREDEWIVGISVKTSGEEQSRLAELFQELSRRLGGMPSPFN